MQNLKDISELVIVVDMINGFIKKGAMCDTSIGKIIPDMKKYLKNEKDKGHTIVFIKEAHDIDCVEFKKFPIHCVKGTQEAQIIEELKPFVDKTNVYEKNSTCALFAKDFLSDLSKMDKLKKINICGCCTDICVLNLALPLVNYFDEKNLDINIEINKNLVATFDADNHDAKNYSEMAFKLMQLNGVKVVDTKIESNVNHDEINFSRLI